MQKYRLWTAAFLFGDGAYELVSVYRRRFFQWSWHIERLGRSLCEIRLSVDLTPLQKAAQKLIELNDKADLSLYIQITRGAEKVRRHAFGDDIKPTVFMVAWPRPAGGGRKSPKRRFLFNNGRFSLAAR